MKLLFTGDINFRGLYEPNSKMCSDILAEILPYFERADFRIINLETPLANKEKHTPIKKIVHIAYGIAVRAVFQR